MSRPSMGMSGFLPAIWSASARALPQLNAHPLQHPPRRMQRGVIDMRAENGKLVLAQMNHLIV